MFKNGALRISTLAKLLWDHPRSSKKTLQLAQVGKVKRKN
jgi:hypothetical protein